MPASRRPARSLTCALLLCLAALPARAYRPFHGTDAAVASKGQPDVELALTRSHDLGWFGGAIVEGPESWTVRPVAEAFVERTGDGTTASALLGAIFRAGEELSFDAALRLADMGGAREVEARLGLTFAF